MLIAVLLGCSSAIQPTLPEPTLPELLVRLPPPSAPLLQQTSAGMTLSGQVMDIRGRVIAGAMLTIDDGPPTPRITTDAQGKWSLPLRESPVYLLLIQARAPGFSRWAIQEQYDKIPAEIRMVRGPEVIEAELEKPQTSEARFWTVVELLYAQRNNPSRFSENEPMQQEDFAEILGIMPRFLALAFTHTGQILPELRAIAAGPAPEELKNAARQLLFLWGDPVDDGLVSELKSSLSPKLAALTATTAQLLGVKLCYELVGHVDPNCEYTDTVLDRTQTHAMWEIEVSYLDGGFRTRFTGRKENDHWVVVRAQPLLHWSGI